MPMTISSHPSTRRRKRPIVSPGGLATRAYAPLSDDALRRIHQASLHVLAHTGVEVGFGEARDIFEQAGATVDHAQGRVFIPPALVEDVLSLACHRFTLAGRDPVRDMDMGGDRVYMGTGGAATSVLDLDGTVRPSTLADIAQFARLVDALDNIHFYQIPVAARDVPAHLHDVNQVYAALANTTKHVQTNLNSLPSARDVVELAMLIAGSRAALVARPILSVVTCAIVSPLRFDPLPTLLLIDLVRQGIPVAISSAPLAGMTAPMALAGTLVQINAEQLSALVLANLVRPGAPVLLGYVPATVDNRTGNFAGGTPEFGMMHAAAAQLGHFYDIPVYNSGGVADSKLPDIQAGYEKALTGMTAALAGSNFIHHSAGLLESLLCAAYEQFVIDDDINGNIMRLVRGIEVTDESLSVDVIDAVCRGQDHYWETEQTLSRMRSECYYPHTADRTRRADWEATGSLDMRQRARQQACDILATHQAARLPLDIDQAIRDRFEILLPEALSGSATSAALPAQPSDPCATHSPQTPAAR